MKRFNISVLSAALFLFMLPLAASAQSNATAGSYYSNPSAGILPTKPTPYYDNTVTSKTDDLTVDLQGEEGDTTVSNDSVKGKFNKDDYYDYEYSARINRFHRDMQWNYYDDVYTNLYWYTSDPFFWGTSIYWGYGWYPFGYYGWRTGWSWGLGWSPYRGWDLYWGWGYYDPFWPGYWAYGGAYWDPFWPYGGYGWGGYSYWNGYRHGYYDGWYDAGNSYGSRHRERLNDYPGGNFGQRVIPGQNSRGQLGGRSTGALGSQNGGTGLYGGRGSNTLGYSRSNGTERRGGVDINTDAMRSRANAGLGYSSRSAALNKGTEAAGRSTGNLNNNGGIRNNGSSADGNNFSGSRYRKPADMTNSRTGARYNSNNSRSSNDHDRHSRSNSYNNTYNGSNSRSSNYNIYNNSRSNNYNDTYNRSNSSNYNRSSRSNYNRSSRSGVQSSNRSSALPGRNPGSRSSYGNAGRSTSTPSRSGGSIGSSSSRSSSSIGSSPSRSGGSYSGGGRSSNGSRRR